MEADEALEKQVYSFLERVVSKGGKLKRGINEVTKIVEKGQAQLVIFAGDVNPPEIVSHLPMLCRDKKVPLLKVSSKLQLGKSAGLSVAASAVAVIDAKDEDHTLKEIIAKIKD
ncbi:MAG: ribosomal L7Ae/L30e/S12e/Gadd45 family protein [Candidatus Rehaiarchaeum fermentans]|nr:ribosomal L7Ae/L30e/S12e/Gadd45 family protein [Candidatus Rehaiarchaeum fermentans]MCW1292881.1 ribosomal L7Ae/L30e/S12e/Gadd45 family protein [Candidatus Rehaiarchaeum fermentans]MCW1293521.1 ribosomal L7Ae/L30e/S12e/Gadd45 family protein [Candidatus Rehaiarchaeum fermentans]MCW1297096.1 ribosomal L7Ae/L30e/S12e/Gadd45 family protein [Candidatus Rehaiarchaeum fermentans]MCW1302409.1 ribosomal L7Ae/L30e/S12e/Gadd45 family protein [Candidatus Rehaiarchaeum fermentans]